LQALTGFALGGTLTSLTAMLVKLSPEGRQGVVFGLDASATSIANFFGPLVGASIAIGFGLEPCFLFAAAVWMLTGIAVTRFIPALALPPVLIPQHSRD
jgi:MFS transporter, DHA1 family, multidrug resistance protein